MNVHNPSESPTGTSADSAGSGTTAPPDPDIALSSTEAAERAGVHPRTVRRWVETGRLPAMQAADGQLRIYPADLDRYLAARSETRPVRAGEATTAPSGQPGQAGAPLMPHPSSDAAGAILNAWRDTVLAPVVAELGETRDQLATLAQALGRAEAERDSAKHELAALRAQLAQGPETRSEALRATNAPHQVQRANQPSASLWEHLRAWIGQLSQKAPSDHR